MAVTKNISLDYQDVIVLGRRGENEAVDIVWDISPLIAEFGGGTALVLAKRATDESAYPVTLTEQTDTTLTWTVSSVDSCVIGVGKVQLFWYVGNVLAKSFMWRTFVGDDITGMVGDPPEAYESWLEHLAEMGADILNDAKDEVKNAEAWAVGERGGEPVVDGDETYHNNSKYWSGVSSDYAGNAESSADAAEQSAGDAAHQVELAEAQVTLAEGQVALAQQKVQDAAAQVALAEAQANAASGSASDASGYALAASGYASDANTYKGQAYTSAQNAAQKASDAAGYALAASGSASDANTYKGQAQGFANAASGYADNASTYANNASGYADAASGYADAAAASATEAAGYVASLVNGKAGVLENSASGDVVSIVPDKSVGKLYKAEVSLSPIQSLNGYDHPWAAGAGKNKALPYTDRASDADVTYTVTADGVKINGTASGTSYSFAGHASYADSVMKLPAGTYTFSASAVPGASQQEGFLLFYGYTSSGTQISHIVLAGATLSKTVTFAEDVGINYGFLIVNGQTANVDSKIMIESGSTKTAFSPYENLCPITGHTGAELNVTGVNAWDEEWEVGTINWNTGENSASTTRIRSTNYIPIAGSQAYYYLGVKADIFYYDENKQLIGKNYYSGSMTLNHPSNTCFIRFSLNAEYGTTYNHDISINYPSTDHEYHAYSGGHYYTSSFGQTVYGGTLDFVSGKLVVTHKIFDLGDLNWTKDITNYKTFTGVGILDLKYQYAVTTIKCSAYKGTNGNDATAGDDGYVWVNSSSTIAVKDTPKASMSAAEFKTAMSGVQLVYELATPIEIDLDPTDVQTLLGLNNVWASDGEMSVDYAADLKTYIDNKIAAAVAALS